MQISATNAILHLIMKLCHGTDCPNHRLRNHKSSEKHLCDVSRQKMLLIWVFNLLESTSEYLSYLCAKHFGPWKGIKMCRKNIYRKNKDSLFYFVNIRLNNLFFYFSMCGLEIQGLCSISPFFKKSIFQPVIRGEPYFLS